MGGDDVVLAAMADVHPSSRMWTVDDAVGGDVVSGVIVDVHPCSSGCCPSSPSFSSSPREILPSPPDVDEEKGEVSQRNCWQAMKVIIPLRTFFLALKRRNLTCSERT